MIVLIYPPVAKCSEPPAGIAKLSGALHHHKVEHHIVDANIEGLLHLLKHAHQRSAGRPSDTWTIRSVRNCASNLLILRDKAAYLNTGRYQRAVLDLNRVLETSVPEGPLTVSLANYHHAELSPLRSVDLLRAAEDFESNPFYPYFRERLITLFRKARPSLVGLSLNYLSQALCTFAIVGFLRREFPGTRIVLGGGLVTSWIKRPQWKSPFGGLVDSLVAGPGEGELLSLLGVKWSKTAVTPRYDFATDEYMSPGILPYSASSGCFWSRCSFCPERAEDNVYIPVAAERVIPDLASLTRETRPALLHFLDNALSPSLLKSLARTPPGVPWYGFARIHSDLADHDFCKALKRSGCVMLKLGIESGDQEVLDRMEKGIDLGVASRVLTTLKEAGIATYVYLLFGTPSETAAAARKTLEFTVRHRDEISFLNLAIFSMPVHGPETGEIETQSFYEGDLSLYTDFRHPHGWSRKEVRHFLSNEFRKDKAVASILRKDPPFFTSNHAPFVVMPRA